VAIGEGAGVQAAALIAIISKISDIANFCIKFPLRSTAFRISPLLTFDFV